MVFRALLPRLDDAEPDDGFFAVERERLDDDWLAGDFFAVDRGRLDDAALELCFFAGALDAVLPDGAALASELPSLAAPRDDFCSDR